MLKNQQWCGMLIEVAEKGGIGWGGAQNMMGWCKVDDNQMEDGWLLKSGVCMPTMVNGMVCGVHTCGVPTRGMKEQPLGPVYLGTGWVIAVEWVLQCKYLE